MDGLRKILRETVGRSLHGLRDEDRIAVAWTLACGRALADRSEVAGFRDGVVRVLVADAAWLRQFESMRVHLIEELTRIAKVKVDGIHFEVRKFRPPEKRMEKERVRHE